MDIETEQNGPEQTMVAPAGYLARLTLTGIIVLGCVDVATAESDDRTLVYAGTLLAIPGESPQANVTIVIFEDRIEQVIEGFTTPEELGLEANAVYDYRDEFVLPGLMDMHVHLTIVTEEGVRIDESFGVSSDLNAADKEIRNDSFNLVNASISARKTLAAGYTTVRNVGDSGWHVFALRDAISQGLLDGPRIYNAGSSIRVGADDGSGACSGIESCRRAVREQIDKGAELIKIYATCSGGKPCGHKDAPAVFLDDEVRAVVETAHTRQLKVAAHAHGTEGINSALRAGVDSIEHGSFNDAESHKLMKRSGAFLVPTISVVNDRVSIEVADAEGPMLDVMRDFVEQHPRRLLAAHKAGVRIASGSDAGVVPHGRNVRELIGYVGAGLSQAEALVTATVNAASLLEVEDDLGTVEAGKIADLVIIDGNPLEDIEDLWNVVRVMKAGMIYNPDDLLRGLEDGDDEEPESGDSDPEEQT